MRTNYFLLLFPRLFPFLHSIKLYLHISLHFLLPYQYFHFEAFSSRLVDPIPNYLKIQIITSFPPFTKDTQKFGFHFHSFTHREKIGWDEDQDVTRQSGVKRCAFVVRTITVL